MIDKKSICTVRTNDENYEQDKRVIVELDQLIAAMSFDERIYEQCYKSE